jgi:uncharacterized repeat protein (TIGR01451 family)
VPEQPAFLAAGKSMGCTGTHVVTPDDVLAGEIKNTATASSVQAPDGTDDESVLVPAPQFSLVKILQGNADEDGSNDVSTGDTLTYSLVVTNIGTANLTNVAVVDPLPGLSVSSCVPEQPAFLAAGKSMGCTGTHVVTPDDGDGKLGSDSGRHGR